MPRPIGRIAPNKYCVRAAQRLNEILAAHGVTDIRCEAGQYTLTYSKSHDRSPGRYTMARNMAHTMLAKRGVMQLVEQAEDYVKRNVPRAGCNARRSAA